MWKKIDPKTLGDNVFSLIGDKWMLISAGDKNRCNTMTASWGGLGILWGAPTATIYVRPQRYTKEFLDDGEYFTLSFLSQQEHKDTLMLCGTKSGRELDKIKACGLTVNAAQSGAPYFDQADLVLVCRKRYRQAMDPEALPSDVKEKWYPTRDYHVVYLGEIVEALIKE